MMIIEEKSHTSEGWGEEWHFPLLVSSSHHMVMDRMHAWGTKHGNFSSTSKHDMSEHRCL